MRKRWTDEQHSKQRRRAVVHRPAGWVDLDDLHDRPGAYGTAERRAGLDRLFMPPEGCVLPAVAFASTGSVMECCGARQAFSGAYSR